MANFYNQATLSLNGNVTSSNITTGEITATLSAKKSAVVDVYSQGNDVVFVISIVNNGSTALNDLTLTDNLGEYSFGAPANEVVPLTYTPGSVNYYINGVQQAAPTVSDTSPLTITGIDVPAGGNTQIIYAAKPNEFAPFGAGQSIVNTVVISGNCLTDITATETITPNTAARLDISKSLSPLTVEENGQVTYTFVIRNYGATAVTAADTTVFRDDFTPTLDNLTAQFNGNAWTEGSNYTYNDNTGVFRTLNGQITVPAATFTQNPATGAWTVQPGTSTLVITGNLS